jgi:hypothetical protein
LILPKKQGRGRGGGLNINFREKITNELV